MLCIIHQSLKKSKDTKSIPFSRVTSGVCDLADMQLISKFNNGFRFVLCPGRP